MNGSTSFSDLVTGAFDWEFLNEPFWRWIMFIVALSLVTFAWNGVLAYMK